MKYTNFYKWFNLKKGIAKKKISGVIQDKLLEEELFGIRRAGYRDFKEVVSVRRFLERVFGEEVRKKTTFPLVVGYSDDKSDTYWGIKRLKPSSYSDILTVGNYVEALRTLEKEQGENSWMEFKGSVGCQGIDRLDNAHVVPCIANRRAVMYTEVKDPKAKEQKFTLGIILSVRGNEPVRFSAKSNITKTSLQRICGGFMGPNIQ